MSDDFLRSSDMKSILVGTHSALAAPHNCSLLTNTVSNHDVVVWASFEHDRTWSHDDYDLWDSFLSAASACIRADGIVVFPWPVSSTNWSLGPVRRFILQWKLWGVDVPMDYDNVRVMTNSKLIIDYLYSRWHAPMTLRRVCEIVQSAHSLHMANFLIPNQ